ncbi:MAG: hypothetical protein IJV72_08355 [Clostridia bacterium]|nr:hypothetical protein [Clostridia bacterium]
MTQKERLTELLKTPEKASFVRKAGVSLSDTPEGITADFLLANGVIALPVKMGDLLYMPWEWNGQKGIAYLTVTVLRCISGFGWSFGTDFDTDDEDYYEAYNCGSFKPKDIGKIVFLTQEEAERALKEGAE